MGKLVFPTDYPWKPPSIMMVTDTGRFETNHRICLSISDYHPESWNPVWPVRSIILGLISFFVTDMNTVGSIKNPSKQQQAAIAAKSKSVIKNNKTYKELFITFENYIGIGDQPTLAAKPAQVVPDVNLQSLESALTQKEPVKQPEPVK